MTATYIESRVHAMFPLGSRVQRVVEMAAHRGKVGTVVGYARGGQGIDGVMARSVLVVQFDGNKRPSQGHWTRFCRAAEEAAA